MPIMQLIEHENPFDRGEERKGERKKEILRIETIQPSI